MLTLAAVVVALIIAGCWLLQFREEQRRWRYETERYEIERSEAKVPHVSPKDFAELQARVQEQNALVSAISFNLGILSPAASIQAQSVDPKFGAVVFDDPSQYKQYHPKE